MEFFMGSIIQWPMDRAPEGWKLCDGQLLPIIQYQALYSLIGNKYGGDGRTNFALPDLRGRSANPAAAMNYIICIDGRYPDRP